MSLFTRLFLAALLVCGLSITEGHASRVDLPYQHCLDDSGDPVSGCRAYTFEAGTTTVHQLYSDAARTSAHGDFVTADSAGRFPDAYGDPAQCIKVEFRLSDGTTVLDTLDDVCPPPDASDASEARTALGIGTAGTAATGTSGNALCLLNTGCTWSAEQTFTGDIHLENTSDAATAGPTIQLSRDSASPALDDILGEITLDGKDDGGNDVEYGYVQGVIIDETDTEEDGAVELGAIIAGTATDILRVGSLDSSSPATTGAALVADDDKYYFSANSGTLYAQERCTPIETQSASASATLDLETIPTGTTVLIVRFTGIVPATDDVNLHIRLKFGGAFKSGASDYMWQYNATGSSTNDTADTEIEIGDPNATQAVGNASGEFADGYIVIHNPLGTSLSKLTRTEMVFIGGDGSPRSVDGIGRYIGTGSTGALQGVRLLMESGNITSGDATSYACFD